MQGLAAIGVTCFLPRAPELEIQGGRAEALLQQAYQECFRTFEIAGKRLTLRIPFGLWKERFATQDIHFWGKGNIEQIWEKNEEILKSPYFFGYLEDLQTPGEKVIYFDLPTRKFSLLTRTSLVETMKRIYALREEFNQTGNWRLVDKIASLYPGNDAQVFLLKTDTNINETDIYHFLYSVGGIGIDCARFVYHCQQKIFGNDLNIKLGRALGVSPENVHFNIGSWFYYPPKCRLVESVEDKISNLRPGDVIHFRGRTGAHSVIIQSIDLGNRTIRYLQCTDWAKPEERGVHESFIYFDSPNQHLKDARWTQELHPTFPGETAPYGWRNEGDRYRGTNSMVVRLKSSLTLGIQWA